MRMKNQIITGLSMLIASTACTAADDIQAWHTQFADRPAAAMERVHANAGELAQFNAIIALTGTTSLADSDTDGPLSGVPLLIKDNIETRELPTTAGSLFLQSNSTGRDAVAVARLREAGALIAGKTNLSEWANFRSEFSSSGWSAVGGQTRNAFEPSRSPCGSSSGSAVVVALGLVPAALGTETNGSVTCPASLNGIVGFKPSVGLVSQKGVIPIAASQDTIGPMTQSVSDAAQLVQIMAATDWPDELLSMDSNAMRLGVIEPSDGMHPEAVALFEQAISDLSNAGVTFHRDLSLSAYDRFGQDSYDILLFEFKAQLNDYFAGLPDPALSARTLADLIAFNQDNAETELAIFGQDILLKAEQKGNLDSPGYKAALARAQATTRAAMDELLETHDLDALIAITTAPAWQIDHVLGDHYTGGFSTFPAVAGYPHLTVPMGAVRGLPVGLSFAA